MIDAMRLSKQNLERVRIIYDKTMLHFLIGAPYALMPLGDHVGALMKIRPYVGETSYGLLKKADGTWARAWGTILFVRYDAGTAESLLEEDYSVIESSVKYSVTTCTSRRAKEPDHATG
jgi:hypothetical protein